MAHERIYKYNHIQDSKLHNTKQYFTAISTARPLFMNELKNVL